MVKSKVYFNRLSSMLGKSKEEIWRSVCDGKITLRFMPPPGIPIKLYQRQGKVKGRILRQGFLERITNIGEVGEVSKEDAYKFEYNSSVSLRTLGPLDGGECNDLVSVVDKALPVKRSDLFVWEKDVSRLAAPNDQKDEQVHGNNILSLERQKTIVELANKLIAENPENFSTISSVKKSRRLIIKKTKVAKYIHDNHNALFPNGAYQYQATTYEDWLKNKIPKYVEKSTP